jgi:hypothetical protein
MKIKSLALKKEDGLLWSPVQMLEEMIREVKTGERACTKCLVISLDDSEGRYTTGHMQSGMSCSQMIALVEVFKAGMLRGMGL